MKVRALGVLEQVNSKLNLIGLLTILTCISAAQPIAIVTSDRDSEELMAAIENNLNLDAFELTSLELPDNKGQILVSQTVLPTKYFKSLANFYDYISKNSVIDQPGTPEFEECKRLFAFLNQSDPKIMAALNSKDLAFGQQLKVETSFQSAGQSMKILDRLNVEGRATVPTVEITSLNPAKGISRETVLMQSSFLPNSITTKFLKPNTFYGQLFNLNRSINDTVQEAFKAAAVETKKACAKYKNAVLKNLFPNSPGVAAEGVEFNSLAKADQDKLKNQMQYFFGQFGFSSAEEGAMFLAQNPKLGKLENHVMIGFTIKQGDSTIGYRIEINFLE